MKQPILRTNISFDQFINSVRKDERDFILGILREHKDYLVERQDFQEAADVRDIIDLIKAKTHMPVCKVNDEEGVAISE